MQFPKLPRIDYVKLLSNTSDFLYIVGIQSIRILKRAKRRLSSFFWPVTNLCRRVYAKTIGKQIINLKNEIASIKAGFALEKKRIKNTKHRNVPHAADDLFKTAVKGIKNHSSFFSAIVNVVAPIAACIVLFVTIQYWTHLSYGLVLDCGGKEIATIQDENVYQKATEMVNQRMVYDTATSTKMNINPTFQLAVVDSSHYAAPSMVCDKIIEQSDGIIEEASGLYVNGDLIGAVKSSADLSYILQNILNSARGNDTTAKVSFAENVETITGLFPTASILSADTISAKLRGETSSSVSYTVKTGDTIAAIATKYKTTVDQLKQLNDLSNFVLRPGAKIKVETANALVHVQLTKKETRQASIAYKTITVKDSSQYTDYSKVTVDGKNGVQKCIDEVTYLNGTEIARKNVSTATVTDAVDKTIVVGTKKRPVLSGIGSGSMIWPVPSIHNITSLFEWRWGKMHNGLDIAGGSSYGRTIVAADSGTVVASIYCDYGYGNHVEINHGNGLHTLYGHASKLLVSEGQKVAKGQAIALIGSSGDATGPHLHFGVMRNGSFVNPLSYVHP
ncbi:MAG TPA: M23 family metallopeptidase [Oscillospiraceae bacterium]|nr:M23 family metallopeptidase [Oscillospiraceae bacterium]